VVVPTGNGSFVVLYSCAQMIAQSVAKATVNKFRKSSVVNVTILASASILLPGLAELEV